MPIYEFKCPECGTLFEELVRSHADMRKVNCPKCGQHGVERQHSVFAAHAAPSRSASPPGGCGNCGEAGGACPFAGG